MWHEEQPPEDFKRSASFDCGTDDPRSSWEQGELFAQSTQESIEQPADPFMDFDLAEFCVDGESDDESDGNASTSSIIPIPSRAWGLAHNNLSNSISNIEGSSMRLSAFQAGEPALNDGTTNGVDIHPEARMESFLSHKEHQRPSEFDPEARMRSSLRLEDHQSPPEQRHDATAQPRQLPVYHEQQLHLYREPQQGGCGNVRMIEESVVTQLGLPRQMVAAVDAMTDASGTDGAVQLPSAETFAPVCHDVPLQQRLIMAARSQPPIEDMAKQQITMVPMQASQSATTNESAVTESLCSAKAQHLVQANESMQTCQRAGPVSLTKPASSHNLVTNYQQTSEQTASSGVQLLLQPQGETQVLLQKSSFSNNSSLPRIPMPNNFSSSESFMNPSDVTRFLPGNRYQTYLPTQPSMSTVSAALTSNQQQKLPVNSSDQHVHQSHDAMQQQMQQLQQQNYLLQNQMMCLQHKSMPQPLGLTHNMAPMPHEQQQGVMAQQHQHPLLNPNHFTHNPLQQQQSFFLAQHLPTHMQTPQCPTVSQQLSIPFEGGPASFMMMGGEPGPSNRGITMVPPFFNGTSCNPVLLQQQHLHEQHLLHEMYRHRYHHHQQQQQQPPQPQQYNSQQPKPALNSRCGAASTALFPDGSQTELTVHSTDQDNSSNQPVASSLGSRYAQSPSKKDIDPGRPKRPMTAYNFFFKEERTRMLGDEQDSDLFVGTIDSPPVNTVGENYLLRRQRKRRPHRKISFEELARSISQKWKNIDPERKKIPNISPTR